jgi:hypothetical protein
MASSVCTFLPNYEAALFTLKSLLTPKGEFVQWGRFAIRKDTNFGLTEDRVGQALSDSGF